MMRKTKVRRVRHEQKTENNTRSGPGFQTLPSEPPPQKKPHKNPQCALKNQLTGLKRWVWLHNSVKFQSSHQRRFPCSVQSEKDESGFPLQVQEGHWNPEYLWLKKRLKIQFSCFKFTLVWLCSVCFLCAKKLNMFWSAGMRAAPYILPR